MQRRVCGDAVRGQGGFGRKRRGFGRPESRPNHKTFWSEHAHHRLQHKITRGRFCSGSSAAAVGEVRGAMHTQNTLKSPQGASTRIADCSTKSPEPAPAAAAALLQSVKYGARCTRKTFSEAHKERRRPQHQIPRAGSRSRSSAATVGEVRRAMHTQTQTLRYDCIQRAGLCCDALVSAKGV